MATSVQSIYQYWKQFDLPTLQKELDDVATEVANRQDESETSRKKLVELSRDFKKNASEDVRKVVTPLLKSFQAEVDGLSKRSKAAEAAFLTLYKKIVETPDPVQALESASQWQKKSQRVQDLEIENANLKSTLKEYTNEFAEVKNQDVTIRQLKAEIKQYEDQLENSVETKLAEKEASMKRAFDEREKELIEHNNVAVAKVQEAEHRADALQTSLNASQQELFVLRSHSDEVGSAKSSEVELIMSDLERANLRAASAERQCELLKEKIAKFERSPKHMESEPDGASQQHVEHELKLKDKQITQLLEEVSQLNAKTLKDKADAEGKIEELAKQLMQKKQALQSLEEKAELFADYDEIKRELAILKSIYLGGDEDHETDEPATDSKSLEALLLEKNKALQLEKTVLNTKKRDLENRMRRNSFVNALNVDCSPPSQSRPRLSNFTSLKCPKSTNNNNVVANANNNANNNSSEQSSSSSANSNNQLTPLRSVVERMACLIGTELVNQYQAKTDHFIKEELDVAQLSSGSDRQMDGENDDVANNAIDDATLALVQEKLEKKEKSAKSKNAHHHKNDRSFVGDGPLTNVDDALNSGVPREIIECIAIQHLQQSLALNMMKIKPTIALDTVEIANHCRQVLNTYNIGQRLLAKCVLNQSQGAVSELLSKPKTWEKLTEKGKESFRRLHAWLSDEPSISILRMISPKRAYGGFRERYPPKPEDQETQDKISAILSAAKEAQRRVQRQSVAAKLKVVALNNEPPLTVATDLSPNDDPSASMLTMATTTPSPVGSSLSGSCSDLNEKMQNAAAAAVKNRSSGRYRHDDIPKEMIFEIYKRELAKLREQEHCFQGDASTSSNAVKVKPDPDSDSVAPLTIDDDGDEQPPSKLAKLSIQPKDSALQLHTLIGKSPPAVASSASSHRNKRKSSHVVRVVQQQQHSSEADSIVAKQQSHLRPTSPKLNNLDEVFKFLHTSTSPSSSCVSSNKKRLSNSACFSRPRNHSSSTDSRRPSLSHHHLTPPKIAPTPVSSKSIDTISSVLSQCVQQAVNDAAAASLNNSSSMPIGTKAFKAILSPITQDQFEKYGEINTEDLVKEVKDYLTQFSISQRLFGEQVLGLSQGSVSDLLARPKPWNMLTQKGREPFIRMQLFMEDKDALKKLLARRAREQQNGETSSQNSNDNFSSAGSPALSMDNFDSLFINETKNSTASDDSPSECALSKFVNSTKSLQQPIAVAATPAVNNTIIPLDQIKTLQKELEEYDIQIDTQSIVREVKDMLLNHNIGQKIFGQSVLGMSQGAVSDLLAKSKSWPNLSVKGKEAFVRMQLWLQDPMKIEKVFQFRSDRGELSQIQTDYKKLSLTAEQQKLLINSLEQDLMQIQTFQRPEAEVGAAAPDETATDVISNAVGNIQQTVASLSRTSPSANADSLLPIVISQRERFRSRVQEVEDQNLQLQQHIALLTGEIERTRGDNVKLYEKIKFLQTYKGSQSSNVNSTTVDETVNRYSTQYEATLDPFQRFGVQERQRRYMSLRTHDKATLSISRLIMSSGTARAVFFFYLIFLHCLVFLVLYKLAYTESCKRDFSTDCVEKYKEHMQLVHGKDVHG